MEKYNASKIRGTVILGQVGYYEKDGYIFEIFSFVDGINIEFWKETKIN